MRELRKNGGCGGLDKDLGGQGRSTRFLMRMVWACWPNAGRDSSMITLGTAGVLSRKD
jgi:hypothetical protein